MPAWIPKRKKIQDYIEAEKARIETLRWRREQAIPPRIEPSPEELPEPQPQLRQWGEIEPPPTTWQRPITSRITPQRLRDPTEPEAYEEPPTWETRVWQPTQQRQQWITPTPETTPTPDYAELLGKPEYKPQPWWRTVVEKATLPFRLLHEKVELPGASLLTAPLSPRLPWIAGETWLEHEQREYKAWKAPKFVKGFTEFAVSLPLFLIPYGGLSIAGSRFIGQAARAAGLARTAKVIEETGKILPAVERAAGYPISKPLSLAGKGLTKAVTEPIALQVAKEGERGLSVGFLKLKPLKVLAEEGFNPVHARRLTERWGKVPGLPWLIKKIDPSVLAYTPEARLTIAYSRQLDMAEGGVRALFMSGVSSLKNPKEIFGIDGLGYARAVRPRIKDASLDMDSIIRFPSKYVLNAEQREYIKIHIQTWTPMRNRLKQAGILERELASELGEGGYLGRVALSFTDKETGKTIAIRSGGRAVGAKQPLVKPRRIENYADAIEAGFRYQTDPRAVLFQRLNEGFKLLIDKEFIFEMAVATGARPVGAKALSQRMIRDATLQASKNTEFILDRIRRAIRGEKLTTQGIRGIRTRNPEIADFLEGSRTRIKVARVEAEEVGATLDTVRAEIEALKEALTTESATNLVYIIKRTGWQKGEISNLTLKQYREITGKTSISPNILTPDKKHIRWEYALDDIATQMGYRSGDALRDAIVRAGESFARLATLSRERSYLTSTIKGIGAPEVELADLRQVIKHLDGQLAHEKRLYLRAKQTATEALEISRLPSVREAFVWQPGMRGYIFPKATAEYINRALGVTGNAWVRSISDVNAIIRFVQTGVDLGPYFIQGLPTFVTRPKVWANAVKTSMEGLFEERTFYRFLTQPRHRATLEKLIPEGFVLNLAEFVEAAPIMAKIPGIGGFFNRWAKWFNFALDGGRLLEAEALLALPSIKAAGGAGVRSVVDHLGKKWGVMSTRWLGITEGQRQVENAVLFYSSRYTRSVIAMAKDIVRGGMEGALARDMAGRMLLGMTIVYYGLCKALGQEPNLDPSTGKFMTVQIGKDHIGFGSSYVALVRLTGNILRSLSENPRGFITLDSKDNPFVRFFRGRVAPTTGVAIDVITGRTFIGEPVDSLASFGKYVGIRNMTPFWLQGHAQGLVGAEPMPGPLVVPAEFFGMRSWPLQPWEKRSDLREYYAELEYGKSWPELRVLDRRKLEQKHSDLKDITEEAWRLGIKRGRPSQVAYGQWRAEHDAVNQKYEELLWQLQSQVDRGEKTGYEFRLSAQKIGASRRFALDRIDERPEYEDVMLALTEPRPEPEVTPQFEDMAYDVYMKLMFAGDLERGVDDYNFEEADRRRQWFINTFGEETYRYVLERLNQSRDIPPLMREYYRAVEVMRPYWQVRDKIEKMFGKLFAESSRGQALISKQRKQLRLTNPEIGKYYELFYSRS